MLGLAKDIKMIDISGANWYGEWAEENKLAEILEIKLYNEGGVTVIYKEAPRISEMTREEILAMSEECYDHQMVLSSKDGKIVEDRLYFLHKSKIDRLGEIIMECTNELLRRRKEGAN
jgi:hypothetical protein